MKTVINASAIIATCAAVASYFAQACGGFPPVATQALNVVAGALLWLASSPIVKPPVFGPPA